MNTKMNDDLLVGNVGKVISIISKKSPLQRKKLVQYIKAKDKLFITDFEKFLTDYDGYLATEKLRIEYAIDSYLKMCDDMVKSQIYFMKTGKYPLSDEEQAFHKVYDNDNEMKSFMIGLALSQFLWSTHYQMYKYFVRSIKRSAALKG